MTAVPSKIVQSLFMGFLHSVAGALSREQRGAFSMFDTSSPNFLASKRSIDHCTSEGSSLGTRVSSIIRRAARR
jgi:hypothetical protein